MNKPRAVPGWYPFYEDSTEKYYLSETTSASGTRDQKWKK